MVSNDIRLEHAGEYLVMDPPHRLSFTWLSPYTGGHASRVDVSLSAQGPATLLALSHQQLPDETRGSHAGGWTAMLDRMDALLVSNDRATPAPMTEAAP